MTEVCLVSMPYVALERPSIALGLLAAVLQRDEIQTSVLYGNLRFAEFAPVSTDLLFGESSPEHCLGDWTFAGAAFREQAPDPEPFLTVTCDRILSRAPEKKKVFQEKLLSVRHSAEQFTRELAIEIADQDPVIVGCTSTFQQHVSSLALLRAVKELAPRVITMIGGANCEATMGHTTHRNFHWVDYVVSGEADGFISELCRLIFKHGPNIPTWMLPAGVHGPQHRSFQYVGGSAVEQPRAVTKTLENLPVPNYDAYFDTLNQLSIGAHIRPALSMESSRGCWWGQKAHCTFCGLNGNGMSFRSRSADEVLHEFATQSERYRIANFEMVDNILDMKYFRSVLPELASQGAPYRLFFEVKSNLSYEQLRLLRQAGVTWIQPGIESLHTEVLALMDKGVKASTNVLLMKWSSELGIRLSWSLLYGFPFEKELWYHDTASWLPAIFHLQPPSSLTNVRIDRFSPYHNNPKMYGLTLTPARMYQHVYPLPQAEMEKLVYFFDRDDIHDPEAVCNGIGKNAPVADTIRSILRKWTKSFWQDRCLLCMEDDGEILRILDTRPGMQERSYILSALERQILLLCESGPSLSRLTQELEKREHVRPDPDGVAEAIKKLKNRKVLLELDGRLINLALRHIPELPANEDFPGGYTQPFSFLTSASL